ncbi:3-phosphoshikimate 1-carboxyvinyltransferase [Bifidobacterium choloepi]|uniref:3-phosphoshikimate 1-carboxyvinyltransferase n=1 Tax=Bifidobacterium choloepi TaxID=2614131 RepID=A0A6I5N0W0_9BIFI|nr:3-phosphoshikimate 1-carboxyvinyltransferase [Bifidobacterium choloepi]NEG69289.1 3-phosphoshikimate 1-carboxyvinyltransferase [Bifidobacterium choloepi]
MTSLQNHPTATVPADPWPAPVAARPLDATVTIPGSKSLSNRYLVLAALGDRPVTLHGLLRSRDTDLMMAALAALGVRFDEIRDDAGDGDDAAADGRAAAPTTVRVTPPAGGRFSGDADVYCGLAGTVMRFVPPLAMFADGPVRFDGDAEAYRRPMGPLLDGLRQLGADIRFEGREGYLPFTLTPPVTLAAGDDSRDGTAAHVVIDSSGSSQFVSGLLLIGSRLPHGLDLVHDGEKLPSMPHIAMTVEDVNGAGGDARMVRPGHWTVGPHALDLPVDVVVEPDLSNAAPFLGAALIAGGTVRVPNWPARTTQPGALLPAMLADLGGIVTLDGVPFDTEDAGDNPAFAARGYAGTLAVRGMGVRDWATGNRNGNAIHGLGRYDMSAAGEIAPSIAALCALADGDTELVGIGHLRGHETNRLRALVAEIRRVGGEAEELPDGIRIGHVPFGRLHGAVLETYADHRMATFAAMLGLAVDGVEIVDVATTRKTIPDFTGMWTAMLRS